MKEEHGLRCTWKKSVITLRRNTLCIDNCKQTLWTTMQLHLELCRLTRELNSIFGTHITIKMTSYLLLITTLCYYIYSILMTGNQKEIQVYTWFSIVLWTSLFLVKLWTINYMCESVTIKANKINKTIHQLTSSIRYADIWMEIYQFALQVMHHPMKLTGMGLFYFGNDLLRKFCMTIAKFLIIMVQLKIIVRSEYG
ncbi:uncharacterized protein [Anoplolepis gracilipes]|uniref:uncharacterized protein n=1 Tax=Anoplolepis gracilipes TaxID=354296 RepID=UPI003B9EF0B4